MNQTTATKERTMQAAIDTRDENIITERMNTLNAIDGPRVGDFVTFPDGTERRISYHWSDGAGWDGGFQTSDGGSYHLGNGYISMSGSLHSSVPADTLSLTDEQREGSVWIFHHDMAGAGRGVYTVAAFRVYECSVEAPR